MKRATASKSDMEQGKKAQHEGLEHLVSQELKEIVSNAIQELKTNHRAVLIMRCYDGMSYAEIAESMGSSEFGTRMLFLRAKKALQKQLSRQGLGRGTLLAALVLFGKMTAPSKAAAAQLSITASMVDAGMAAGMATLATGKAAMVSMAAAGAITVGGVVHHANNIDFNAELLKPSTGHYSLLHPQDLAGGMEKHWHFLPRGAKGPLFMRAQHDRGTQNPSWVVLQNAYANYVYSNGKATINNAHWYLRNWRVMRLPHDSQRLHRFLDQIEGVSTDLPTVRVKGNGALISTMRTQEGYEKPTVIYNDHVLEEEFFLSDLVSGREAIDLRDPMHRQGWGYFRISGFLHGQQVRGNGCIPFVYNKLRERRPWLQLKAGDVTIADSQHGAVMYNGATHRTWRYPAFSFFAGLTRPWSGLHVLDTIRRDAATCELPFTTEPGGLPDMARVTVDMDDVKAIYTIDLDGDFLDRITLEQGGKVVGKLEFAYSAQRPSHSFNPPKSRSSGSSQGQPGPAWIVDMLRARGE